MSPLPGALSLSPCPCPVPAPPGLSHLALPVDTDVIGVLPARGPVHHGRRPLRVEVEALGQAVEGTGLDTPWGRSTASNGAAKQSRDGENQEDAPGAGLRPLGDTGGTLPLLHSLGTWAGCARGGNKVVCSYLGHSWHFTSCKTLLATLPMRKLRQQLLSHLPKVFSAARAEQPNSRETISLCAAKVLTAV